MHLPPKNLSKTILFLYFTILIALFSPKIAYGQTILFEDHFDGDLSKWQATRESISDWSIINGMVGATVSGKLIEIVPKDEFLKNSWGNYSLELDLLGKQGVDKNIAFRFQALDKWNEIHHTYDSGGWYRIYLERVWPNQYRQLTSVRLSETANKPIENNNLYHLKIVVNNENIKVYITEPNSPERLIINYDDTSTPLLYGKIGLKIGTGASTISEVWFDNVVVRTLPEAKIGRAHV